MMMQAKHVWHDDAGQTCMTWWCWTNMYDMMMLDKHVCHDDAGQRRGWLSTGFWKKYPMPWTHQHWYIQIYYVDAAKAILQPSGLGGFSSIYKKVTKLFIHPHEGYAVAFKPLNRKVKSGNQCPLTGYLVYRWGLVAVVLVGR
jgi:hypothetical protein